jgi:hypothetical protein
LVFLGAFSVEKTLCDQSSKYPTSGGNRRESPGSSEGGGEREREREREKKKKKKKKKAGRRAAEEFLRIAGEIGRRISIFENFI